MNATSDSPNAIKSVTSQDLPISFYWVEILIILSSAALQTKAASLWSESRMLRKINNRNPKDIIQAVSATTFEGAFSELYISLSKGRHTLLSRSFKTLYSIYAVVIDNIAGLYSVELYSSDAVAAIIILISLGSWTVLGARRLTPLEILLLCFFAALYCTSLVLYGSGTLAASYEVVDIFFWMRFAVLLLLAISSFGYLSSFRVYYELPDIVAAMATDKFSKRRDMQEKLERMKRSNSLETFEDLPKSCPYWSLSAVDWMSIGAWAFIYATNAVVWGSYPQKLLPRVVVIEVFEFISTVFLFINDTQVEPTLFLRLIQLAQYKCLGFASDEEVYDKSGATPKDADGVPYSSSTEDSSSSRAEARPQWVSPRACLPKHDGRIRTVGRSSATLTPTTLTRHHCD